MMPSRVEGLQDDGKVKIRYLIDGTEDYKTRKQLFKLTAPPLISTPLAGKTGRSEREISALQRPIESIMETLRRLP